MPAIALGELLLREKGLIDETICKEKNPRLGKVGGQAVIEGVMMRSGEHLSVSVRSADGRYTNKKFNVCLCKTKA